MLIHRLALLLVLTAPLLPGGAVAQAPPAPPAGGGAVVPKPPPPPPSPPTAGGVVAPTPPPPPAAPGGAAAAPAAAAASTVTAARLPDSLSGRTMVTFVSGKSVYIAAGSQQGVYDGSRVVVVKKSEIVAELKVRFLSSNSAACDLLTNTATINVYDSVRYSVLPRDTSKKVAAKQTAAPRPRTGPNQSALRQAGIRGRFGVSLQLLAARDALSPGTITQPSVDARVDGTNVGGSQFFFSLDARSRQTYSSFATSTGGSQNSELTRVYQAMIAWVDPKAGVRVAVGRQFSATISPLSLFDGVTAEIFKPRWSYGVFAGTQPDPLTMAWSAHLKEFGGYVQLHRAALAPNALDDGSRWAMTLGAIDSYDYGAINREFLFVQGTYANKWFNMFGTQEVDYNRGWKVDSLHQAMIQPTATFINAQFTLSDALGLFTGYDNRRNVVLYRDLISPETLFDDTYRQGIWGGIFVTPARLIHLSFDARLSSGGANGKADSYSAGFNTSGGFPMAGMLRLRATRYLSAGTAGWLFAGAFGMIPATRVHFELNGGVRQEQSPTSLVAGPTPQTNVRWMGLDVDVGISQSWYVLMSLTRTTGQGENNDQAFVNLSYRF